MKSKKKLLLIAFCGVGTMFACGVSSCSDVECNCLMTYSIDGEFEDSYKYEETLYDVDRTKCENADKSIYSSEMSKRDSVLSSDGIDVSVDCYPW
ncbi:MAG: hypothetical protein LBL74_06435 [Bacteroidales bacterium]|nr:hypothetical protein [Bacteroidales bacterium]